MNKQTLDALIAGADKWERNALANVPEDAQIYGETCELCKMFHGDTCDGCPVKEVTGRDDCYGSPWDGASSTLVHWELSDKSKDPDLLREDFRRAAKAEAKFIRSLIPPEGATE